MPFSEQNASSKANGKADHRDVRFPMHVETCRRTDRYQGENHNAKDVHAGFGEEQPNKCRPKGDHENDAENECHAFGHMNDHGSPAMNGTIDDAEAGQQSIWAELPSFVERGSGYIDGWKPSEPTGDFDLDFLTGEL